MKRILLLALIYFCPISAQFNPCYDDLYLSLKAKGLNALSTREYHYFTRKDEECSEYNIFDKKSAISLSQICEYYRQLEPRKCAKYTKQIDKKAGHCALTRYI